MRRPGKPDGLTVLPRLGSRNWTDSGLNQLTGDGLVKRNIGGHYGMSPKYAPAHPGQQIEAYCWPQGVMSQWLREWRPTGRAWSHTSA